MRFDVFGRYVPGTSLIHRLPTVVTMLMMFGASLTAIVIRNRWVTGAMLASAVVVLLMTGLPWRRCFSVAWPLVVFIAAIAGYHALRGRADLALVIPGNILAAVLWSRVLILTNAMPALLDAIRTLLRPLGWLGVDTERIALSVVLMIRSIPQILVAVDAVRDAARARNLGRNPVALLAPVVVQTVAYAHMTGEALIARGLGESNQRS